MSAKALPNNLTEAEAKGLETFIERCIEDVLANPGGHFARGDLLNVKRAYAKVFKRISANKTMKMLGCLEQIAEKTQVFPRTRIRAVEVWNLMKEQIADRLSDDGAHVAPVAAPAVTQFNAQVNVSTPAVAVDRRLAEIRERVRGDSAC